MPDFLHLRKHLSAPQSEPHWPTGIRLASVTEVAPEALHAILTAAYANGFGSVAPVTEWWPAITADSEYDAGLCFVAVDAAANPVGFALCWNSGFIKDIAVSHGARGQGIGQALLRAVFRACQQRGIDHVDLKVMPANQPAIRLYHRVGMVEVSP